MISENFKSKYKYRRREEKMIGRGWGEAGRKSNTVTEISERSTKLEAAAERFLLRLGGRISRQPSSGSFRVFIVDWQSMSLPQECFNVCFYWTSYAKYPNDLTSKQEMANMYKINTRPFALTPARRRRRLPPHFPFFFFFLLRRDSHNCIAKIRTC